MKKLILILLILPCSLKAQIFQQNFDQPGLTIADITGPNKMAGQFDFLDITFGDQKPVIDQGNLLMQKELNNTVLGVLHNLNAGDFLALRFLVEATHPGLSTAYINIFIGDTFNNSVSQAGETIASDLSLDLGGGSNNVIIKNSNNPNPGQTFSTTGFLDVAIYVNTSNSSKNYLDPNGNSATLSAKSSSTWINGVNVAYLQNESLVNLAAASLNDVKFSFGGGDPHSIRLDNIVINNYQTLPVSLLHFTAESQNNTTQLDWATASEYQNKGFYVERSSDGKLFSELGFVPSPGSGANNYSFSDPAPFHGNTYYRLIQEDLNGTKTVIGLVAVNHSQQPTETLRILGEPETERFISYTSAKNETGDLIVMDLLGRIRYRSQVQLVQGVNSIPLPEAGLSNGHYLLQIKTYTSIRTAKFTR